MDVPAFYVRRVPLSLSFNRRRVVLSNLLIQGRDSNLFLQKRQKNKGGDVYVINWSFISQQKLSLHCVWSRRRTAPGSFFATRVSHGPLKRLCLFLQSAMTFVMHAVSRQFIVTRNDRFLSCGILGQNVFHWEQPRLNCEHCSIMKRVLSITQPGVRLALVTSVSKSRIVAVSLGTLRALSKSVNELLIFYWLKSPQAT